MKTLKIGDKGNEVKELQKLLHVAIDGIFGNITLEAVKQFQINHNLTPDGIVGNNTWRVLQQQSPQSKRKINDIILHCSATQEGKSFTVEDIRKWHKAQGWSDIGYHYLIYLDGSIHKGRDESISGAHCENHNSNSIGVCYIGGVDKNGKPKDTRNKEQKQAQHKLIQELLDKYNLTLNNVHCHNQYSNKACPSHSIDLFKIEHNK